MKKALLITVILLSFNHCFAQSGSTLPIALTIKMDSAYEVTSGRDYFERAIKEGSYEVNTDSVKQRRFNISIEIKNTGNKPVNIWLKTCSWQENFLVNNNYIHLAWPLECLHNIPMRVQLAPGQTKRYDATLMRSIKFDYPCKNCIYGPQVTTTKIGLIIVDDIFKPALNMLSYDLAMEDKSKWQIVWSNALYLLKE